METKFREWLLNEALYAYWMGDKKEAFRILTRLCQSVIIDEEVSIYVSS